VSRTGHSGLLSGRMNVDIVVVNRGERTGVIGNERCPRIGRDLESIEVCAGDARGVSSDVSISLCSLYRAREKSTWRCRNDVRKRSTGSLQRTSSGDKVECFVQDRQPRGGLTRISLTIHYQIAVLIVLNPGVSRNAERVTDVS